MMSEETRKRIDRVGKNFDRGIISQHEVDNLLIEIGLSSQTPLDEIKAYYNADPTNGPESPR